MSSAPRRRLAPGQHGAVTTTPLRRGEDGRWQALDSGRKRADAWRARASYVDWNGHPGEVSRRAATKAEAEVALAQALREALADESAGLGSGTKFTTACERWLDDCERSDSGKSARTVHEYRGAYERCVKGETRDHRGEVVRVQRTALSSVTLGQANDVQRLERFLRQVADERGTSSVKHVRAVLSGVLQDAVRKGVLSTNAMRSVGRVESQRGRSATERDVTRAFTLDERAAVLALANDWAEAVDGQHPATRSHRRAVADLVRVLAATGMRIGEALSLRWDHVDLEAGSLMVHGTKSAASKRRLDLPAWLGQALRERREIVGGGGLVFAAPRLADSNKPWDQSNSSRAVTRFLAEAGMPWARSHTLRKTVATLLADSGAPLRDVADWLGHADPSMTARVYLGRNPLGDKSHLAAAL